MANEANIMNEVQATIHKSFITFNPYSAALSNLSFMRELLTFGFNNDKVEVVSGSGFGDGIHYPTRLGNSLVTSTDSNGTGMTVEENTATIDVRVEWKTLPIKAIIPKDAIDVNRDDANRLSSTLLSYIRNNVDTLYNTADSQSFGDGTGDDGNAIDGLGIIISTDPESIYGGIDPKDHPQWKPLIVDGTTNPDSPTKGDPVSEKNIKAVINYMIQKLSKNGQSPTHLFVDDTYYTMIDMVLEEAQRVSNTDLGRLGYTTLVYKNVKICNAGGLKVDGGTKTPVGSIPAGYMYFVNMNAFGMKYFNRYKPTTSQLEDINQAMSLVTNENGEIKTVNNEMTNICYLEPLNGSTGEQEQFISDSEDNLTYYMKISMKYNIICADRSSQGVFYSSVPSK